MFKQSSSLHCETKPFKVPNSRARLRLVFLVHINLIQLRTESRLCKVLSSKEIKFEFRFVYSFDSISTFSSA